MNSIPASQLVNVIPSVLGAGGSPLSLNAVFLTQDTSIPIGTVQPFTTLESVQDWFGPNAVESQLAAVYFAGFTKATRLPGTLYFAQFNDADVAAYLRSGSFEGVTLSQLQALSGVLTLTIDGSPETTGNIDLSGASSFSNAAALVQTALDAVSTGTTCTYDSLRNAFVIVSPTDGASSTLTFCTGTLSAGLKMTSATGAVLSQGAAATTPGDMMDTVTDVTQNWATFMTTWEPDLDDKLLFADWVNASNQRYLFVCWDSDATALAPNASASFGVLTANFNGVCPVWNVDGTIAALVCGITASIDFLRTNGRLTYAYRSGAGLVAEITSADVANNLISNGYNFYGAYATSSAQFTFLQDGQVSGDWNWLDTYVNQIQLNAALQQAMLSLLVSVGAIPYNARGFGLVRAAAADPINAALNFGSIVPGVELSDSQIAQVNSAAGINVATPIQQQGYYLQILPPAAQVRVDRGSPVITLWYTDGGSIQKITLASIAIE